MLPQAIRRVVPPLLNDLVSLQKDSGLIAVLGVIDAIRAAQIETATDFNFTPYVVAGALFVVADHPADPDHRLGGPTAGLVRQRRRGWTPALMTPARGPGAAQVLRRPAWCSTTST